MRFFTPNHNFMPWLKAEVARLPKMMIIDCGCGDGSLVREMRAENLPAIGLDPTWEFKCSTTDLDLMGSILSFNAEEFPLIKTIPTFILVCRPCHSGFPILINNVRHPNSIMFYIGLEHNITFDLGGREDYQLASKKTMGEEGEKVWQVRDLA